MSDLFSDDQLNAAARDGAPLDMSFGNEAASAIDLEALKRTLGSFAECTQSVLATVMNRKTTVEIEACRKGDPAEIAHLSQEDALAIRVPLTGGANGDLVLVMTKKEVALLSDLMMLGDGSAPYGDEHKDAISELASQIMGSFVSRINGKGLQPPASAGSVAVAEVAAAGLEAAVGGSSIAAMKLAIDGMSEDRVTILIPDSVARPLMAVVAAHEPAPAKPGAAGDQSVGLSAQELNDLADASVFDSGDGSGFTETAFGTSKTATGKPENIDMLLDVDLDVSIELGRANLSIKRILELAPGSIVELDRMAGEPVDLLVNNTVVAKGEVVVVDENFGIRIVSLVSPEDRIRSLR